MYPRDKKQEGTDSRKSLPPKQFQPQSTAMVDKLNGFAGTASLSTAYQEPGVSLGGNDSQTTIGNGKFQWSFERGSTFGFIDISAGPSDYHRQTNKNFMKLHNLRESDAISRNDSKSLFRTRTSVLEWLKAQEEKLRSNTKELPRETGGSAKILPTENRHKPVSPPESMEKSKSMRKSKMSYVYIEPSAHSVNMSTTGSETEISPSVKFQADTAPAAEAEEKPAQPLETAESDESLPPDMLRTNKGIEETKAAIMRLITGSRYSGMWRESVECMEGVGIYTYPDGSEYRGNFKQGRFHGNARLHLAAPYHITFKGTFVAGKLTEIEDFWFDDGLHVKANLSQRPADLSQWTYCNDTDRRYALEQRDGLAGKNPYSLMTASPTPREIPPEYYDVEEGLYNPRKGLIIDRNAPFTHVVAPSHKHMDWILRHCRRGSLTTADIATDVRKDIIADHLHVEEEDNGESEPTCNRLPEIDRHRYFAQLYTEELKLAKKAHQLLAVPSDTSLPLGSPRSSSSPDSFADRRIHVNVLEALEANRRVTNLPPIHDLEREYTNLMNKPAGQTTKGSVAHIYT